LVLWQTHVLHPEHPDGAARRHRGQHPLPLPATRNRPIPAGWNPAGRCGPVVVVWSTFVDEGGRLARRRSRGRRPGPGRPARPRTGRPAAAPPAGRRPARRPGSSRPGLPIQDGGQLPGQVVGVLDAGAAPEPAGRGDDAGRVPDQEHLPGPVAVGQLGAMVNPSTFRFGAGDLRVEPDLQVGQAGGGADQLGDPLVGEALQRVLVGTVAGAEPPPDRAVGAVGGDQVVGPDGPRAAVGPVGDGRGDPPGRPARRRSARSRTSPGRPWPSPTGSRRRRRSWPRGWPAPGRPGGRPRRSGGVIPRSRGWISSPGWRSTTRHGTPCQARNTALDSPVSAPPTTSTEVRSSAIAPPHRLGFGGAYGRPSGPGIGHRIAQTTGHAGFRVAGSPGWR
jgi:hypothetical protein